MAPTPTGRRERCPGSVGEVGQRRVGARVGHASVMELVAAHHGARRADGAVGAQGRLAVAEVHPALGEAGRVAQQPGHRVMLPGGVHQPGTQRHEAAALAMHPAGLRERRQPCAEPPGGGQGACVQLGVAAGKPAGVAAVRRRLVRQGGERHHLGTGGPPAREQVGIDEAERRIGRERDALAGRGQPGPCAGGGQRHRGGGGQDGVEVQVLLRHVGEAVQERGQIGLLGGLHEPEVAFGQGQRRVARQGAQDG